MIDALLATVSDPFQAMMSVVFLFALGMYPVGLMLGSSCSACCEENPCTLCEEGSLPDTVTVTFDNLPNQTRSQDLLRVGFFSCFGSGATARILDPGGDPDSAGGPIASVSLTSGGSGYAKFARVEPELSVSSAGNNDAEFSFSFDRTDDSCGIPTWGVAGVTVTKAGTGYTNNTPVTFTANEGTTQDFSGSGTIRTRLEEPTATLSVTGGEGVSLQPTFALNQSVDGYRLDSVAVLAGGTGYTDGTGIAIQPTETTTVDYEAYAVIRTRRDEPVGVTITANILSNASGYSFTPVFSKLEDFDGSTYYGITSVTVNDPGTGWQDFESVIALVGDNTEQYPFYAVVRSVNEEPTLQVAVVSSGGSSATLQASLQQTFAPDFSLAWRIVDIAVTAPGSGYSAGDQIQVTLVEGQEIAPLSASLEVNEAGEIIAVTIGDGGLFAKVGVFQGVDVYDPGYYFRDSGIVESVRVFEGGIYYNDTGEVASIDVNQGGRYYKEDATGTPYVADVTVTLEFAGLPSQGSGAEFSAVVDSTLGSPTFGQITAVNVTNGGDGYLAWVWRNSQCCGDYWNGQTVVLRRNASGIFSSDKCTYIHRMCTSAPSYFFDSGVVFEYDGPTTPPQLYISGGSVFPYRDTPFGQASCSTLFLTAENITNCSSINLAMTSASGATATVVAGGDYDPLYRYPESPSVGGIFDSTAGASCHMCCKGEEPVPPELEATITDNSDSEFNISGTYVLAFDYNHPLRRRSPPGYYFESPVPIDFQGRVVVDVRWRPCSSFTEVFSDRGFRLPEQTTFAPLILQPPGFPVSDICDDCHNRCFVQASAASVGGRPWDDENFFATSCDQICEDTPICNLTGRSFSLCTSPRFFGDPPREQTCGQVTIQT